MTITQPVRGTVARKIIAGKVIDTPVLFWYEDGNVYGVTAVIFGSMKYDLDATYHILPSAEFEDLLSMRSQEARAAHHQVEDKSNNLLEL